VWAVIGSIFLLGCGLLFALVLAPQQKLEAQRIEKLPFMDATTVMGAIDGEDLLVTGVLVNNPVLMSDDPFVAYHKEEWDVTVPDYDPNEPNQENDGDWRTVERAFPNLQVDVSGQIVQSHRVDNVAINGALHEAIYESNGYVEADYLSRSLPEGSLRVRGFYNGDLVTVWGVKASSGGIIPNELYAGDRVSFEESQHAAARGLLIAGISMLVCSPIVLVGGILSSIFGRRRR
jgi:hypothetical protein